MKRVALFFFIFIIIISIYFYFSIDSIEMKNLNENNCIAIEDRSEKTIYLWDIVNNIAYKQKKTAWPFVIGEPYFGGGKIWFRKGLILKGNYYDNYYYCDINKIISKQAFEADLGNDLIVGEKIHHSKPFRRNKSGRQKNFGTTELYPPEIFSFSKIRNRRRKSRGQCC